MTKTREECLRDYIKLVALNQGDNLSGYEQQFLKDLQEFLAPDIAAILLSIQQWSLQESSAMEAGTDIGTTKDIESCVACCIMQAIGPNGKVDIQSVIPKPPTKPVGAPARLAEHRTCPVRIPEQE